MTTELKKIIKIKETEKKKHHLGQSGMGVVQ